MFYFSKDSEKINARVFEYLFLRLVAYLCPITRKRPKRYNELS